MNIKTMHHKKYENIIKLNNTERYNYLVRKVIDFQSVYLIYGRFWQMSTTILNGVECVLIFPEKEFAKIHISKESAKKVKKRDLYKFIDWLNKDKFDKISFAVFPNKENDVKIVNASELRKDLLDECKLYE